jgi:hypothetical protein
MTVRRSDRTALLAFAIVAALAGWAPWAPLRMVTLVLFIGSLPVAAAVVLQQRALGRRTTFDLQIGATLALLLLMMLAVGAFFVGLSLPLDRGPMVLAFGVLAVVLYGAARVLPQTPHDHIDAAAPDEEVAPSIRVLLRSPGRVVAYGVAGVCVAAAVIVSVISQQHYDHKSSTTALGIEQTANTANVRTYRIDIIAAGTRSQRLILTIRVSGRSAVTSRMTVHPGDAVRRIVKAPASSSITAALAMAQSPAVVYRSVHIGH